MSRFAELQAESNADKVDDVSEDSLEKLEADCLSDISEAKKGFRDRLTKENKRFQDMCDTEYWCCVCFTSRAQKEEFLSKLGLDTDEKYIDGKQMARAVNRALETPDLQFAKIGKPDKTFMGMVRE